jgi:signal transduction histidine kinase
MLIPQSVAWAGAAIIAVLIAGLLSRQRRMAGELRAARTNAQALADLLDVWQWRTDAEHRLTQLRPPSGAPSSAWTAPPPGETLWGRFRAADEAAMRACVTARAPVSDLPVQVHLPGGKLAHAQLRGIALSDAEGRFAGYQGTLRVLSAAPMPPRPALSAPGPDSESESFSYTVSHDLRAPVRVVEGFTKILKEDYGRLLDRIGNDHLDRVLGAAARMNCMIDALLALSQLSTQPLARQPVNLSQLAGYIADDLRRQSPERRVSVHIEPELHVQGDPTLLRVALENLLGNAWKYTGKCREPQIWFGRDTLQTGCVFTMRDNGAGFDMRFADRLFGVFQRLHSASDFQGTGIGLASVRRIVRRHGGDIWAEGEVDRGATFRFTLGNA